MSKSTEELHDKFREIHNRFHGRFDTHAQVAKHSGWTAQELENVQIEDEWLMYDELSKLLDQEIEKARIESGTKIALVFLELLKQNDLLSGLGEGVLEHLYESMGVTKEGGGDD